MPRAAGTSHAYSWKLKGVRRGVVYEIHLPSVTHIIKVPKDAMGFGAMSWWGFGLGIRAAYPDASDEELAGIIEELKLGDITPNKVRDEAGARGEYAHNMLENVALDAADFYAKDGAYWYIQEGRKPVQLREWGVAAARWWLDNEAQQQTVISAERPVWHLGFGFQGTLDLVREHRATTEIVDYKTHKPAQGMHKDGSYQEGLGPGYIEDLAQLQAYKLAYQAMGGGPCRTRVVLLSQDGEYHEDTRQCPDGLFLQFKAMHDVMCRKPSCIELAGMYDGRR